MSSFHAINAAVRSRHADRATLVTTHGHVDFLGRDQGGATRRGTARRVPHLVGIMHGASGIGVASAREAEGFAMGLADNGTACI